jgi:putative transposase
MAGLRPERLIPNDQEFLMATLPTTPKGTARITPGRGVKINHIFYWSAGFQTAAVENHQVPVRYDPFDAGTAYAFVEHRWVQCHSEYYVVFRGRSEKEMMLASGELRRRQQRHGQGLALTAKRLAGFLHSVEADELLMAQRLRDQEAQATRGAPDAVAPAPVLSEPRGLVEVEDLVPRERAAANEIYGEF